MEWDLSPNIVELGELITFWFVIELVDGTVVALG
jgi:hypothetical protein